MNAILPDSFREFASARGVDTPSELIVDGFAGGGGASEGIEAALRRMQALDIDVPEHVSIAINHDEAAIAMHRVNHPGTLHLPHDIWKVNALRVTNGLPVGLMWASPDCRHHSKAKGGRPVSKSVRDLPWVVAYWAKQVRPRMIFLENVEEMRDWGPLLRIAEGVYKPDPARKGQTFDTWVGKFIRLGYRVELRQLRARDYGVPTIRKRLYIVMRCDGLPIVWPEPTHGNPKSEAVLSGRLLAWPIIADCIDWQLPCPSILMDHAEARAYTKATGTRLVRPLAEKTLARIAKGVKRYVLDAAEPFIVTCNHGGTHYRGQSVRESFATVTRSRDAHGLVVPHVQAYYGHSNKGGNDRSAPVDEALRVVTTEPRHSLIETSIAPFVTFGQHDGGGSRPADEPLHTVEASTKNTDELAAVFLAQHTENAIGLSPSDAAPTITTRGTQTHQVGAFLVPRYGEREGQQPRTRPIDEAGPVIVPTGNGGDLAAVFLAQNNTDVIGHPVDEPSSTIVGKGSTQSLVAVALSHAYTSNTAGGQGDPRKPLKTIVAGGNHASLLTLPLVTAYYGQDQAVGSGIDEPMRAATGNDRFGYVEAKAAPPPLTEAQLVRARQVAALLRRFGCWDERELVTVSIGGVNYVVVDIGMRMLTARELARAQGFRDSYVLAAPYKNGVLSDTEQRHKIGNSVCPGVAEAIVFANYRPRVARWQPTARAA